MGIEFTHFGGGKVMDNQGGNNRFSVNFMSLQLQLKTLLEEAGGDELVPFLDTLGSLTRSEQKIVLKVLTRTIKKLVETTPRFATDGDLALKQFEESLYQDLAVAIDSESTAVPSKSKIEVLPGGKNDDSSEPGLIDLDAARKKRRAKHQHLIN